MVRQFFGRKNYLLNAPEAIHHVLVDNHANYRRSPASIRILRPIPAWPLPAAAGERYGAEGGAGQATKGRTLTG